MTTQERIIRINKLAKELNLPPVAMINPTDGSLAVHTDINLMMIEGLLERLKSIEAEIYKSRFGIH